MTVHDVVQRSAAWRQLRCGKLTASRASAVLARVTSGEAATRRALRAQLVHERVTGRPAADDFASPAMPARDQPRGPCARRLRSAHGRAGEAHRVCPARHAGDRRVPDGVIEDFHGLLEVKVPSCLRHLDYLRSGRLPPAYRPQVLHLLWVTNASWLDFVSYRAIRTRGSCSWCAATATASTWRAMRGRHAGSRRGRSRRAGRANDDESHRGAASGCGGGVMTAQHWTGNDDRDTLAPDYARDDCAHCLARWNEPCVEDCACPSCVTRRARACPPSRPGARRTIPWRCSDGATLGRR